MYALFVAINQKVLYQRGQPSRKEAGASGNKARAFQRASGASQRENKTS